MLVIQPKTQSARKLFPELEAKLPEEYELVKLQYAKGFSSTLCRLFVDYKDPLKGISHDDCTRITKVLMPWLIDSGYFEQDNCKLEVSSPGIDRPLTKTSHFKQAIGERVRISHRSLRGGSITGNLQEVNDSGCFITSSGYSKPKFISWDQMEDAHIVFRFTNN